MTPLAAIILQTSQNPEIIEENEMAETYTGRRSFATMHLFLILKNAMVHRQ
jgi:hypothetical protein